MIINFRGPVQCTLLWAGLQLMTTAPLQTGREGMLKVIRQVIAVVCITNSRLLKCSVGLYGDVD